MGTVNEQFERKLDLLHRVYQHRERLKGLNAEAIAVFGGPLVDTGLDLFKEVFLRIFTTEQDA